MSQTESKDPAEDISALYKTRSKAHMPQHTHLTAFNNSSTYQNSTGCDLHAWKQMCAIVFLVSL